MEPNTAVQILGIIVETYAGVVAIGSGFFTLLSQRCQERTEREEERIREDIDDHETIYRLNRIGTKIRKSYTLFTGFFILCFIVIILSFIFMGMVESTPKYLLDIEVWTVEGIATIGFLYIIVFARFLLHPL